jgi:hypothetical protein
MYGTDVPCGSAANSCVPAGLTGDSYAGTIGFTLPPNTTFTYTRISPLPALSCTLINNTSKPKYFDDPGLEGGGGAKFSLGTNTFTYTITTS